MPTSPRYRAPASVSSRLSKYSPPFSAPDSTTFPPSKRNRAPATSPPPTPPRPPPPTAPPPARPPARLRPRFRRLPAPEPHPPPGDLPATDGLRHAEGDVPVGRVLNGA